MSQLGAAFIWGLGLGLAVWNPDKRQRRMGTVLMWVGAAIAVALKQGWL